MHYKLGQLCFITNSGKYRCKLGQLCYCGSYWKFGQPLLHNRETITNWGRYYKLCQLLQIRV